MLKIFFDFEFTRMHQKTTPISLGMVSEDGHNGFYAEFTDYDRSQVDEWLKENILSQLTLNEKSESYIAQYENTTEMKGTISNVVTSPGGLYDWLESFDGPLVLASYSLSYDDVLFRELFRTAKTSLPGNIRQRFYDVCTLFQECGYDPDIEGMKDRFSGLEQSQRHNALFDAKMTRQVYLNLKKSQR